MDAGLTAAAFGLVGALIGSVSSVATMVVQSRYRDKRDRVKQVIDLALAEYSAHLELVKSERAHGHLMPITAYIHNNSLLLKALDDGDLTAKRISKIMSENGQFNAAVREGDHLRRQATS